MTVAARTEHAEAVALMKVVKLHEAKHPPLRLLFAVPNGGDRHKIVAAKMKAEGVKPGVPDYLLPVSSPGYLGLAVELKSRTGYASKEQKQWIADLRAAGWKAEVCRGWEQAWGVIRQYVEAMTP
ncbi:VRR-NUC domain-containing protein [Novilysobacter erysipheiresistens]|uniref:VRR-NUC domain-containing protein n=1 Tax=Novilysobacter erysipheiresistens TaxID=1749332 RepID=A0ABU7YUC4_9GAMM